MFEKLISAYLKGQYEKHPQPIKTPINMQKGTDFNKIRLRLPSSSNTVVATLQRNDKCVKTDFKEKNAVYPWHVILSAYTVFSGPLSSECTKKFASRSIGHPSSLKHLADLKGNKCKRWIKRQLWQILIMRLNYNN